MGRIKDLTGQRFGRLLALEYANKNDKNGAALWKCLCDCGNIVEANASRLKIGEKKSCGCLYEENLRKKQDKYNLVGKKYNKLLVIKEAFVKNGKRYWECECDCGNKTYRTTSKLIRGEIKSCGCLKYCNQNNLKHHKKGTRIYRIWSSMKQRCLNKNSKHYRNYGAREIKVCDEWKNDFMSFYNWAIANGYRDNLTIDRIDVNGNYEPSNCRWTTVKEQANNRRNNNLIEYDGEKHNLQEWIEILPINISHSVLWGRIYKYNWDVEKAFTTPVDRRKNRWKK